MSKARPSKSDRAIISITAQDWADREQENHPDLIPLEGNRRAMFVQTLSETAFRALRYGAEEMAAKLADRLNEHVDYALVDAMESFISHHEATYAATVAKWVKGWGPEQPFKDYARIEANAHDGPEIGLGVMFDRYKPSGEFLFLPDRMRAAATEDSGFIRSWQVLRWEDVVRQLPLLASDNEAMYRHREAEREAEARRADAKRAASFKDMVAGHADMDPETAASLYREIAGSPEKAALIVAALRMEAERELAERREATPAAPAFSL